MYRTAEPRPQIKRLAIELGAHPEALRTWTDGDPAWGRVRTAGTAHPLLRLLLPLAPVRLVLAAA